jgi:hypothetical protein
MIFLLLLIIIAIICSLAFWIGLFIFSVADFAILLILTIIAGIVYSLC